MEIHTRDGITVQWYLDANVTNSTNNNPIEGAEVNINNSFGANVFNGLTSITGAIAQQVVTEFALNGSVAFMNDSCRDISSIRSGRKPL